MELLTSDDFGNAKRLNRIVLVYDLEAIDYVHEDDPETSALSGRGYIVKFDEHIVSILDLNVGMLHFFREQFVFYLQPEPVN